jgi:hypothetical protein
MKIRRNSITWGESGRIKALDRAGMSPGPKIRVLLAVLVSSLLGLALLTYVKSDDLFINAIIVLFCAMGPMVFWADLYAGRGIELTANRITMLIIGKSSCVFGKVR